MEEKPKWSSKNIEVTNRIISGATLSDKNNFN
jgi:hypothetical protein